MSGAWPCGLRATSWSRCGQRGTGEATRVAPTRFLSSCSNSQTKTECTKRVRAGSPTRRATSERAGLARVPPAVEPLSTHHRPPARRVTVARLRAAAERHGRSRSLRAARSNAGRDRLYQEAPRHRRSPRQPRPLSTEEDDPQGGISESLTVRDGREVRARGSRPIEVRHGSLSEPRSEP